MTYDYKTAAIPANLISKGEGAAAAQVLQQVIDREATEGWEFYRVDSFTTTRPPGCFSFGQPGETASFNVATFRREA